MLIFDFRFIIGKVLALLTDRTAPLPSYCCNLKHLEGDEYTQMLPSFI